MSTFALCHDDIFTELEVFEAAVDEKKGILNGGFAGTVERHLTFLTDDLGLRTRVCDTRLEFAFERWKEDLVRASALDMGEKPLDHFKRLGYLVYWLKRVAPVIEIDTDISNLEQLSESDRYYAEFLYRFVNEHLAFSLGFEICCFFECAIQSKDKKAFGYDSKFIHDLHTSMQRKNISPHAIMFIYRSLFHRP